MLTVSTPPAVVTSRPSERGSPCGRCYLCNDTRCLLLVPGRAPRRCQGLVDCNRIGERDLVRAPCELSTSCTQTTSACTELRCGGPQERPVRTRTRGSRSLRGGQTFPALAAAVRLGVLNWTSGYAWRHAQELGCSDAVQVGCLLLPTPQRHPTPRTPPLTEGVPRPDEHAGADARLG